MNSFSSMKKSNILSVVLALLVSLAQCEDIKFFYTIPGGNLQCFLQNIQVDHVGQFQVKSESNNIIMSVSDPRGRELGREMGQKKMVIKFDAE